MTNEQRVSASLVWQLHVARRKRTCLPNLHIGCRISGSRLCCASIACVLTHKQTTTTPDIRNSLLWSEQAGQIVRGKSLSGYVESRALTQSTPENAPFHTIEPTGIINESETFHHSCRRLCGLEGCGWNSQNSKSLNLQGRKQTNKLARLNKMVHFPTQRLVVDAMRSTNWLRSRKQETLTQKKNCARSSYSSGIFSAVLWQQYNVGGN